MRLSASLSEARLRLKTLFVLSAFIPSCDSLKSSLKHLAGVERCGEWIER